MYTGLQKILFYFLNDFPSFRERSEGAQVGTGDAVVPSQGSQAAAACAVKKVLLVNLEGLVVRMGIQL